MFFFLVYIPGPVLIVSFVCLIFFYKYHMFRVVHMNTRV